MSEGEKIMAIKGGTLIDGTGGEPMEKAIVLVEGSNIIAVGKEKEIDIPEETRVIDATEKTVMPGLIDSHMHLRGLKKDNFVLERLLVPDGVKLLRTSVSAQLLLNAGFTTVKDCGGSNALYLKRAIAEGTLRGPRIVAAGYVLTQTFGHADDHFLPTEWVDARMSKRGYTLICDGVEECIKAARYALREGADFVKLCGTSGGVMSERDRPEHVQFTLDEIKAVVQVAHSAGKFVTAHAQGTEGIHNAITGGVKTADHVFFVDDEAIEMGKSKGVVFVSSLTVMKRINEGGIEAGYPLWGVQKSREAWDEAVKNIAKIREAGATVASATDLLEPPTKDMSMNALELELLVEHCGFKPIEAIVSATCNGAKACGLEDKIGTIEKGKLADIIIVDGDPLKDIKILQNLERIKMVIKEGVIEVNRGL